MKQKHTPLPWEARGAELVGGSTLLATLHWHSGRAEQNEADAVLLPLAVNNHSRLVLALKTAAERLRAAQERFGDLGHGGSEWRCEKWAADAEAVLADIASQEAEAERIMQIAGGK